MPQAADSREWEEEEGGEEHCLKGAGSSGEEEEEEDGLEGGAMDSRLPLLVLPLYSLLSPGQQAKVNPLALGLTSDPLPLTPPPIPPLTPPPTSHLLTPRCSSPLLMVCACV